MAEHPVAVGIALGTAAVFTGGAALFAEGGLAAGLATTGVLVGATAAALDGRACVDHPGLNSQCVAAGLGVTGVAASLPELAVTLGLINEPAFQEFLALAVGSVFASDVAVFVDTLTQLYTDLTGSASRPSASNYNSSNPIIACLVKRLETLNT